MRLNPNKEVFIVPNIKSAKKRVLVSASKTARNKAVKSNLKTPIKKAEASIAEGGDSREAIRLAIKRIDQAQAKGILHKNTAARRKSKLVRKLNNANA